MKLTPWFEPNTCPKRNGVYETRVVNGYGEIIYQGYSYFNGEWCDSEPSIEAANRNRRLGIQTKIWRGLEEDPNA